MTAAKDKYDDILKDGQLVPLARWGLGEDVGKAAASILLGNFPFTTGHVIPIDGGFHIKDSNLIKMLDIDKSLKCSDLTEKIDHLWTLSGQKILSIENITITPKGHQSSRLPENIQQRLDRMDPSLNMDLQHYSLRQPKMNNSLK